MKTIRLLCIALCTSFFLTSCTVNWGTTHFDVHWSVITIPVILILLIAHLVIIRKTYICPDCQTEFRPKWYEISSWLHIGAKRAMKCPHCHRKGFFSPKD